MRQALITGITGQDGSYLASHLLKLGYEVLGTSRSTTPNTQNLEYLNIHKLVQITKLDPLNISAVENILQNFQPTHVFALGSLSSVSESFRNPISAENSIYSSTRVLLESMKKILPESKLFHPSSSEMFGDISDRADENTCCKPLSPYGYWKLKSHELIREYRTSFGMNCVSGILFNHESPLRGNNFFTRKLITGVVDIYRNEKELIEFGNLEGIRDWGWAPDYAVAMELLLNQQEPFDAVIATGEGYSLKTLVSKTFEKLGLNWENHVRITKDNFRPQDIKRSVGNPSLVESQISWKNSKSIDALLEILIEIEMKSRG